MSNNLRTRNGMPFNFVNGLKVRGMDIESLIPGIEGIPEAGSKYQFAGDGTNKSFTLPVSPYNKDAVDVYVKQLYVHPDDYTLVGDTVTLVEAPPAVVAGETYNVVIKVSLTTLNGYVNANRVSFEGENLDDILEKSKPLANYSNLRAYAGAATQVRITDPGIAGFFYRDDADTVSADNGGTVIVSSNGKRWKRVYDGYIHVKWFGVTADGITDDTAALQKAIDAAPYGGTVKIDNQGTSIIDTLPSVKIEADLGSNWLYGGIYINKPMKIIGNKNFKLKIKDFSTAWTNQDVGDSVCGLLITSSDVHVESVNIDANSNKHYEVSGAHKYWETGPTLKRPPCGFTVSVARNQANVRDVLIENCSIYNPLAGISFLGNAVDAQRAAFLSGSLATGVVKDCVSRNNRFFYARGNCVLFNMGVDNCVSDFDVFVDDMYHAVRAYSRSINCRAIGGRSHVNSARIIARYNETDLGYWRTTDTTSPQFKIVRSGYKIGGEGSYDATYGYSVINCGFDDCVNTHETYAAGDSAYFDETSVYLASFSVNGLKNCFINDCESYGAYVGVTLFDAGVGLEDAPGIVVTGNIIANSRFRDFQNYGMKNVTVKGNTFNLNETIAYTSAYIKDSDGIIFADNVFNGVPFGVTYTVYIAGTANNQKFGENKFPVSQPISRRYAQDGASSPAAIWPKRIFNAVSPAVIDGGVLSNGWAPAYGSPLEGQENQLRVLSDGSVHLRLNVSGVSATASTVATLNARFRPGVSIGFICHNRANGDAYWGRILTDGRIQITMTAYPTPGTAEIWLDALFDVLI